MLQRVTEGMKFPALWLSFVSVWGGTGGGDIHLVCTSPCTSVQNWTKAVEKNSDRDSNNEHAGICINPSEHAECTRQMSNLND